MSEEWLEIDAGVACSLSGGWPSAGLACAVGWLGWWPVAGVVGVVGSAACRLGERVLEAAMSSCLSVAAGSLLPDRGVDVVGRDHLQRRRLLVKVCA